MKKTIIFFIDLYKNILSYIIKGIVGVDQCCRFYPTCSDYAKKTVAEKGALKGTWLSLIRVLKCQPFYNQAV